MLTRIGVDVGGTNTDAVLMQGDELLAQAKVPTTPDVTSGIESSIRAAMANAPNDARPSAVMLGTTHFTNALLERRGLAKTAVLRLCLPATTLLPPLCDWPEPLKQAIGGRGYMAHGGHEFDGREISSLDAEEVRNATVQIQAEGVEAVAVSGVFSPIDPIHEERAADVIRDTAPELRVTLSHRIGRVGILERENAAALNAALSVAAERIVPRIRQSIAKLGLNVPLYLSQNDGTLMDADFATRYPVFTIASGPTNSMRGAAFLSGVRNGIVVDVGGTSTDAGALINGFPREASVSVEMAGVRTNFRMPDVTSIALGGGSIVETTPLRIGPTSVGHRLTHEARVFGGKTLTASDLAVAGSLAQMGNPDAVKDIDPHLVNEGLSHIQRMLEDVLDRVKLSRGDVPLILVGGGSVLAPTPLAGASEIVRPPHAEVANAIGAAIAQVGGQVEKVYDLNQMTREEALADARTAATQQAINAGADPATIEIVEVEEIPLTYLPSNATRIRTKAVGSLSV